MPPFNLNQRLVTFLAIFGPGTVARLWSPVAQETSVPGSVSSVNDPVASFFPPKIYIASDYSRARGQESNELQWRKHGRS